MSAGDRTGAADRHGTPEGDEPVAGTPPADWAVPLLDDTNRTWFTSGRLAVQRCTACGTLHHPPVEVCPCGGTAFDHRELASRGTVHSCTVVHHAVNDRLAASLPYVVVLVSLAEAPELRVVGNVLGSPPGAVAIGDEVEAVWEERRTDDGTVVLLPQWRLV